MDDAALYNRLKAVRAQRGLTQADLAEAVGVSRKTINTVENRVFIPSTILALKLAQALDCPVSELFALDPFGPDTDSAENGG
ncbi:MAG: helix-turn-helix domain-containing protein [Alphaproteobacteria bacterium]|jgi:putative transcriptional regulator|nr:helix-turn-helix domain-containing protein [Alphaproteobacteria bacterium]